MENFDIIIIAVAIVQVITLIVFFVMANNVSEIKKKIDKKKTIKELLDMAQEEKYIGNKGKAIEYFFRAKYRCENYFSDYIEDLGGTKQIIAKIDKEVSEIK